MPVLPFVDHASFIQLTVVLMLVPAVDLAKRSF